MGILCRVCNGEQRDYTREGYNVVFKPRLQCRWASYPWKWKLFVHETYCENISFLSEANKRKVYHEIPPEPDLGVVLKEENEEEDKDKPKVSTFWKDGVVFNLVREVWSVALVLLYYVFQINYLTWEWKLPYVLPLKPFHSQDLSSYSPYCLQYNLCGVSLENLVLDQIIIPKLMFFFFLITALLMPAWFLQWYIVRRKSVLVTHEI